MSEMIVIDKSALMARIDRALAELSNGVEDINTGKEQASLAFFREVQHELRESAAILSRATPSDVCERCKGSGQIDQSLYRGEDAIFEGMVDCPKCDATGEKKSNSPYAVTAESVERSASHAYQAHYRGSAYEGMSWQSIHPSDGERWLRSTRAALESFANSLPAARVQDGEVRLWDTQWMSIVNHDNCYRDWSKDDAIVHAVKMTEQAIARNIADGKLPPKKTAAALQAGEPK